MDCHWTGNWIQCSPSTRRVSRSRKLLSSYSDLSLGRYPPALLWAGTAIFNVPSPLGGTDYTDKRLGYLVWFVSVFFFLYCVCPLL